MNCSSNPPSLALALPPPPQLLPPIMDLGTSLGGGPVNHHNNAHHNHLPTFWPTLIQQHQHQPLFNGGCSGKSFFNTNIQNHINNNSLPLQLHQMNIFREYLARSSCFGGQIGSTKFMQHFLRVNHSNLVPFLLWTLFFMPFFSRIISKKIRKKWKLLNFSQPPKDSALV